ncbi:hypothetical protein TSUD_219470 [Trifolium subterraneum]|uniref:Uncharacterized protein n=1 Tax=Trifolium subterraneum TaxID=3900 RepID=A0A2Z6PB04_TRISU|nr:hypothetical protein TSUD_219470 [Trifolium subterraneum]
MRNRTTNLFHPSTSHRRRTTFNLQSPLMDTFREQQWKGLRNIGVGRKLKDAKLFSLVLDTKENTVYKLIQSFNRT